MKTTKIKEKETFSVLRILIGLVLFEEFSSLFKKVEVEYYEYVSNSTFPKIHVYYEM